MFQRPIVAPRQADNMNTTDLERDSAHCDHVAVSAFVCGKVFWRCARCSKLLGVLAGGVLSVRHQKVEIRTHLPTERRCEKCGTWNRIEERVE